MMKLASTYTAVKIKVTTAMTVKLLVCTASTANLASPGQANTVSTATEPVINPPSSRPAYVSGAIEAFLKACFQTTDQLPTPLARASLMY